MKRRPFLLLEALIAVTILTLALLPLMGLPFRFAKEEAKSLELMTLEREALNSFLDIQERIHNQVISWNVLGRKYGAKLKPFEEKTIAIQLNKKVKGLYKQKTTIYNKKKKNNPFYLVKIKFEYQRTDEKNKNNWHTFTYPLLLEKA